MSELRRVDRVHAARTMAQCFVRTSAGGHSNRRAIGCTVPAVGRLCALSGLLLLQHPVRPPYYRTQPPADPYRVELVYPTRFNRRTSVDRGVL